ncbi:MAG: formyl transferase [Spirochaetes bacterium]|nr:formyl transferase [Spirochaetota bacterium]
MKCLILADGNVGFEICRYLINEYADDIHAIVTTAKNQISAFAEANGVSTYVYTTEEQLFSKFTTAKVDTGLLLWWPHILHSPLIDLPRDGFINTHPSLLPYARGKHYNFWTIVEQAPFGVTLHKITPGIDDGAICFQREIKYTWLDTGKTLYQKAQAAMTELFIESYPKIRTKTLKCTPQDLTKGSFHRASELHGASKIDLDLPTSPRALLNRLRARTFEGHPACWFEENDEIFEVRIQITRKSQ